MLMVSLVVNTFSKNNDISYIDFVELVMAEFIRVLHVDDDADFADLTAEYLEKEADDLEVVTESSASDGLTPGDCPGARLEYSRN